MIKSLTGHEASVLSMLALGLHTLPIRDKIRIASHLSSDAFDIAEVIIGVAQNPSEEVKDCAQGFIDWAARINTYQSSA